MKRLTALCLGLLLLLSACASKPTESTTVDTVEEPSDEVTQSTEDTQISEASDFGLSYLPEYGMNPYTCTATVNRALFSLLYESLFVVSNQFRAEPVLCETFKVADGGTAYTFTLVSGITFSDGTPLTVNDVTASIEAARTSPIYQGRLSHLSYYVANEDGSLTIVLNTAYENFSLMLDIPIVKASTVKSDTPIGTGPYRKSGNMLVRNTHWWKTQLPTNLTDTITLTSCTTPNAVRDNFEFGATDLVYCDPNSAASVGYRCDYEVWDAPTTVMHYLGFNCSSGYFANETLRTAVTYAIDRDMIVNSVYGGYALASVLPCSPASDLYDAQLAAAYDYEPQKFTAAIQAANITTGENYVGYAGTLIVNAEDPTKVAAAEYIAEVLQTAGLNITVSALESNAYRYALQTGSFDLYYGEVRLTANFDLSEFFSSYGSLQFGSISDAALSALCTESLANSGSYAELCAKVLEQAPICAVVFKSNAVYVTRGSLNSLSPAVDFIFHSASTARSLADADKTYADVAPVEPTDVSADATDETDEANTTGSTAAAP